MFCSMLQRLRLSKQFHWIFQFHDFMITETRVMHTNGTYRQHTMFEQTKWISIFSCSGNLLVNHKKLIEFSLGEIEWFQWNENICCFRLILGNVVNEFHENVMPPNMDGHSSKSTDTSVQIPSKPGAVSRRPKWNSTKWINSKLLLDNNMILTFNFQRFAQKTQFFFTF